MVSIGALNNISHDDSTFNVFHEVCKEEQEAAALQIYNEALLFKNKNEYSNAEEKFKEVLETELIEKSEDQLNSGEILTENAALYLKYNVYKHLGELAEIQDDTEKVLDNFMEAAYIDESDICLWWKIGAHAFKTFNMQLARFSYEKGLQYSPAHFPSLDKLIEVLYIIGDYAACLNMISHAFERNQCYIKGFAFRDQIFKEEVHFKKDCVNMRKLYIDDDEDNTIKYQEIIEAALVVRGKKTLMAKSEDLPSSAKLSKPLQYHSWLHLGDCLLKLYDDLTDEAISQPCSLGWKVDLSKYECTKDKQAVLMIPPSDFFNKKFSKSITNENENKGIKRKKLFTTSQDSPPKRRSTRVKLSKSKECDVNWSELVYSFFPSKFRSELPMEVADSQESTQNDEKDNESEPSRCTEEILKKEAVMVSDFINTNQNNSGCISIIERYLLALAQQWETKWMNGVSGVFKSLYQKLSKHTHFPNPISTGNDMEYMLKLSKVILISLEFRLDLFCNQNKIISPPTLSPFKNSNSKCITDEMTQFLRDLHYLHLVSFYNENKVQHDVYYMIRFYWMQGRYFMIKNEVHNAEKALSNCQHLISIYSEDMVKLHNCKNENVIQEGTIQEKLNFLQQSQTLDELEDLFEEGKYNEVIALLHPYIFQRNEKNYTLNCPERPSQLMLLQKSYSKIKKYKKCMDCIRIALNEALNNTTNIWQSHFDDLLSALHRLCCTEDAIKYFTDELKNYLVEKLTKFIELTMEGDLGECDYVTTLPWLVIFHLLTMKLVAPSENEDQIEQVEDISIGVDFLKTAHEYLGRKHWCCHNDGILLQIFVKQLQKEIELKQDETAKENLLRDLEQCLYCLYGNPCKKSKTKTLQDHCIKPIVFTWENVKVLYDFYKPDGLPVLDLKTHTISYEIQNVFRKISAIAPYDKIEVVPFAVLNRYIDGGDELPSTFDTHRIQDIRKQCGGMHDLFYYLGDFYFKNKEFNKALKYYMHDVCVQPLRFQSWAAMALTRGSRLEEKINQCEIKVDSQIKKHIVSTLRCFEKAVSINNTKCVLYEEYGQTAYMLNSYAARKLQQDKQEEKPVSPQQQDTFIKMRKDMLILSKKCFTNALQLATNKEGEKWMHYYMLGKTSEQLRENPSIYLQYYQQSLQELFVSGGHFLKKIQYHGAPEYSIESVELFYRIHASVLKILKRSPDLMDYELLNEHLEQILKQEICLQVQDADKTLLKELLDSPITPSASKSAFLSQTPSALNSQSSEIDTSMECTPSQITINDSLNDTADSAQFDSQDETNSETIIETVKDAPNSKNMSDELKTKENTTDKNKQNEDNNIDQQNDNLQDHFSVTSSDDKDVEQIEKNAVKSTDNEGKVLNSNQVDNKEKVINLLDDCLPKEVLIGQKDDNKLQFSQQSIYENLTESSSEKQVLNIETNSLAKNSKNLMENLLTNIQSSQTQIDDILRDAAHIPTSPKDTTLQQTKIKPLTSLSIQTTIPSIQTTDSTIQATIPSIQTTDSTIQATIRSIQTTDSTIQSTIPSIQTTDSTIQATIRSIQTTDSVIQSTIPSIQTTYSTIQSTVPSIQSICNTIETTSVLEKQTMGKEPMSIDQVTTSYILNNELSLVQSTESLVQSTKKFLASERKSVEFPEKTASNVSAIVAMEIDVTTNPDANPPLIQGPVCYDVSETRVDSETRQQSPRCSNVDVDSNVEIEGKNLQFEKNIVNFSHISSGMTNTVNTCLKTLLRENEPAHDNAVSRDIELPHGNATLRDNELPRDNDEVVKDLLNFMLDDICKQNVSCPTGGVSTTHDLTKRIISIDLTKPITEHFQTSSNVILRNDESSSTANTPTQTSSINNSSIVSCAVLNPPIMNNIVLNPLIKDSIVINPPTKDNVILKQPIKSSIILNPSIINNIILNPPIKDNVIINQPTKDNLISQTSTGCTGSLLTSNNSEKTGSSLKIDKKFDGSSNELDIEQIIKNLLIDLVTKIELNTTDQETRLLNIERTSRSCENKTLTHDQRSKYETTAMKCLEGFAFCLRRFPEHYKSQYAMAHFLAHTPYLKNLQWSRDLLIGQSKASKYDIPLPSHGIFSLKKKTNMFQYLWRIPVNEVDRPGSFCNHIYKSVYLLLHVLSELQDNQHLLHVSAFLHKTPDKDRKYLRDNDRALLAVKALEFAINILKNRFRKNDEEQEELISEVYEVVKHAQKMQISVQTCEYILIKIHRRIQKLDIEWLETDRQQEIDAAVKYCLKVKPLN